MKTRILSIILVSLWIQTILADPIHNAVNNNDLAKVKELVEKDKNLIFARNNYQRTPLMIAADEGHFEIVKYLVEKGSDVNARNNWNNTPLLLAAKYGHYEVVEYLIEKKAIVNAYCEAGSTPMHWAVQGNYLKIAKYLIEHGANINAINDYGATPLISACWGKNDKDIFELLLENGASLNYKDNQNQNCINNLVWNGKPEVVKFLVDKGVDVNLISASDGRNALISAAMNNKKDFIAAILPRIKNINLADKNNKMTAIHYASVKGYYEIVEMLLNAGADATIKDMNNKTAPEYAIQYGFKKIADLYVSKGMISKDALNNIHASLISGKAGNKEAIILYNGCSGWTVKTRNHLIIFDYWENTSKPFDAGFLNGYILPNDLKGQNVYVFSSHDHSDHFDTTSIFGWNNKVNNVKYIYGFDASQSSLYSISKYNGPVYTYIPPENQQQVGDIKITTMKSNDTGEGFLLEVDGLSIFHAGDHACRNRGIQEDYMKEVDFIGEKVKNIDIAFIPVSGCGSWNTEAVTDGFFYVIDKLNPKAVFPMHGFNNEHVYKNFKTKAQEKGYKIRVECAENKGDVFKYSANN